MVVKKGRTNLALILYPDGTCKEVHPANDDYFEIEELMQIVEGTIQIIPLPDGRIMTLNEEDRPNAAAGRAGLPPNEQATALAGFPFNVGPLATLRGLGVESPSYAVGPGDLAYIPGRCWSRPSRKCRGRNELREACALLLFFSKKASDCFGILLSVRNKTEVSGMMKYMN